MVSKSNIEKLKPNEYGLRKNTRRVYSTFVSIGFTPFYYNLAHCKIQLMNFVSLNN
jgi:hypothetical protein